MEQLISLILDAGRTAIDMALYILLPVMVVMLAVMKLLDAKGVLAWFARYLSPALRIFGLPGLAIFAMLKLLFVSFNAPVATLAMMDRNGTSRRFIASTLAMVLTMSQANVVFPMLTMGLNLPVTLFSSIVGGLFAAAVTYYLLGRALADPEAEQLKDQEPAAAVTDHKSVVQILSAGGQEGLNIVLASIPLLILALLFVNILEATDAISVISYLLSPVLALVGLPESTVLPIVTKFIAGGTAFMGVTVDLMNQGLISPTDLNRMVGFATNPLDVAGVAIMAAAGKRVGLVARTAVYGALCGMVLRGAIHLIWF